MGAQKSFFAMAERTSGEDTVKEFDSEQACFLIEAVTT